MALIQAQTTDLNQATGYDPEKIQLGDEDTVESRVAGIISKNSPLMKRAVNRATTAANQGSNRRGLLNSSIGLGEAVSRSEDALYSNALPIASQDADTSFQSKLANQQAGNQAQQFTAGAANTASLQRGQGQQALEQIREQGDVNIGIIGRQQQADTALQRLRGGQSLDQIRASGDVESRLVAERGQIESDLQTADAATRERLLNRQAEINTELQQLVGDQTLERMQAGGDIESQLQDERGQIQLALQDADAQTRERLLNRQAEINQEMAGIQTEAQSRLQAEKGQIEKDIQAAASANDLEAQRELLGRKAEIDERLMGVQANVQSRLQEEKALIVERLQNADAATQKELMDRQGAINQELTQIQNEFQAARDETLQNFQTTQNDLDRQFQGAENQAQRDLMKEEVLRNTATELMRQISGQNATMMDAVGTINASDITRADKTALTQAMSTIHFNNLQTTTAMSDFDVVDGQVVYRSSSDETPPRPASPSNYPYPGDFTPYESWY